MHWVFGKLIWKGAMSQNIVSFYASNKQTILTIFEKKKQTISTPSTSSKCTSLATNPMMLNFLEDILHLLN
jgi:hypothetical protein